MQRKSFFSLILRIQINTQTEIALVVFVAIANK